MLSIAGIVLPMDVALKIREPCDLALIGFAFQAQFIEPVSRWGVAPS